MMMHAVDDRQARAAGKFGVLQNFSEEILTEKTEMDMYDNNIDTLNNELNQAQDPSQVGNDDKMSLKKEEEEIQCLNEEHTTTQL
jgi:hypothetical protein